GASRPIPGETRRAGTGPDRCGVHRRPARPGGRRPEKADAPARVARPTAPAGRAATALRPFGLRQALAHEGVLSDALCAVAQSRPVGRAPHTGPRAAFSSLARLSYFRIRSARSSLRLPPSPTVCGARSLGDHGAPSGARAG